MSDLETAIYNILSNDPDVIALVGLRIYPLKAPDSPTFPFITYFRVATVTAPTLDPSVKPNITEVYIQIDIWASKENTFATMRSIANKIRNALHLTRGTYDSIPIQGIFHEQENYAWEEDVQVYRTMQEYKIMLIE